MFCATCRFSVGAIVAGANVMEPMENFVQDYWTDFIKFAWTKTRSESSVSLIIISSAKMTILFITPFGKIIGQNQRVCTFIELDLTNKLIEQFAHQDIQEEMSNFFAVYACI